MPEISFYRQRRYDDGIRTGIDIAGWRAWHHFQPGRGEPDPALLWYVDLRCESPKLPRDPDEIRQWFLDHAKTIKDGFRKLAADFAVGIDADVWPLQRALPGAPRAVRMTVVCSAVHRLVGHEVATVFADIAEHLEEYLEQLEQVSPTSV